mmetsp:Transcript_36663/g.74733  ORF Transcript_36663/g.74733 Transcript_36663/m.74733 type:complete len:306 (+) Transcript_36663:230-1147(+)
MKICGLSSSQRGGGTIRMTMSRSHLHSTLVAIILLFACIATVVVADDYTVAPGNKSLLVALGCFWCAEQAFEQYAPGVVEAVSGYAGGTNDSPTYRNHPGHFEVILIEYDPTKTSYELLVNYAWRNLDPFDAIGQFCDKGTSYRPAIFYETEEERLVAESVRSEILEQYPDWTEEDEVVVVPNLERPKFWTAEEYHQNYYIKNPNNYGYYKERCGRTQRLKQVWGEDEYRCYHDLESTCFNMTVVNEVGEEVVAEVNVKEAPPEKAGVMPNWAIIVVSVAAAVFVLLLSVCLWKRCCSGGRKSVE